MGFLSIATLLRAVLIGMLLSAPVSAKAAGNDLDKLDKGPKLGTAIPHPLDAVDQNGRSGISRR